MRFMPGIMSPMHVQAPLSILRKTASLSRPYLLDCPTPLQLHTKECPGYQPEYVPDDTQTETLKMGDQSDSLFKVS